MKYIFLSLSSLLLVLVYVSAAPRPLPTNKNAKILVVGAGPAGLHMTMLLQMQGYTNIEVWERTNRVGGKSVTLYYTKEGTPCKRGTRGCVAFEMGTCFTHGGYHEIRRLITLFNLRPEVPPIGRAVFSPSLFKPEHYPVIRNTWTREDYDDSGDMSDLVAAEIRRLFVKLGKSEPSEVSIGMEVLKAMGRYNREHRRLFGLIRPYGFPIDKKFTTEEWSELSRPASEFVERHNLQAIMGFLRVGQAAQGYGYLNEVSTLYLLYWMTPELIHSFAQQSIHQGTTTLSKIVRGARNIHTSFGKWVGKIATGFFVGHHAIGMVFSTMQLPDGFNAIWDEMSAAMCIKYNRHVKRVEPKSSGGVRVTYTSDRKYDNFPPNGCPHQSGGGSSPPPSPSSLRKEDPKGKGRKQQRPPELGPIKEAWGSSSSLSSSSGLSRSSSSSSLSSSSGLSSSGDGGSSSSVEEFDIIFYSAHMRVAFGRKDKNVFTDATDTEKSCFSRLEQASLTTTIYQGLPVPYYTDTCHVVGGDDDGGGGGSGSQHRTTTTTTTTTSSGGKMGSKKQSRKSSPSSSKKETRKTSPSGSSSSSGGKKEKKDGKRRGMLIEVETKTRAKVGTPKCKHISYVVDSMMNSMDKRRWYADRIDYEVHREDVDDVSLPPLEHIAAGDRAGRGGPANQVRAGHQLRVGYQYTTCQLDEVTNECDPDRVIPYTFYQHLHDKLKEDIEQRFPSTTRTTTRVEPFKPLSRDDSENDLTSTPVVRTDRRRGKSVSKTQRSKSPSFLQLQTQRGRVPFEMLRVPFNGNHGQFSFPYFPHFTPDAIRDECPWRLYEEQGARSRYLIGSSVSFESVHDVILYNCKLGETIFGGGFKCPHVNDFGTCWQERAKDKLRRGKKAIVKGIKKIGRGIKRFFSCGTIDWTEEEVCTDGNEVIRGRDNSCPLVKDKKTTPVVPPPSLTTSGSSSLSRSSSTSSVGESSQGRRTGGSLSRSSSTSSIDNGAGVGKPPKKDVRQQRSAKMKKKRGGF